MQCVGGSIGKRESLKRVVDYLRDNLSIPSSVGTENWKWGWTRGLNGNTEGKVDSEGRK